MSNSPIILNTTPSPNTPGLLPDTTISFDIVDIDNDVDQNSILVEIDGDVAFRTGTFFPPFNGALSAITLTTVGIRSGYRLVIDNTKDFSNGVVSIYVTGKDLQDNIVEARWSFLVGFRQINSLYFSDGRGIKKINIKDLVGESQDKVRTILDDYNSPPLPSNNISHLSGQFVGSDFYLLACHDGYAIPQAVFGNTIIGEGPDGYSYWGGGNGETPTNVGVSVVKNETEINVFAEGYGISRAQITPDGTLYLLNQTENRIDVFYGADQRLDRTRPPDFIYNVDSTPPIISGEITDLHVVTGASSVCSGASRIYIGTTKGVTRIESCDLENPMNDGYSLGQDSYGVSFNYSVVGVGAKFEVLGGTAEQVVSVHSDEDSNIFIVATDDGYGNGGVTQVSISGNRQVSFLSEGLGTLPNMSSGTVRDSFPAHLRDVFGRKS